MRKTANLRSSTPEIATSRVTIKNYKKLLNAAGFENHKHLAGEINPISLFPDSTVSFKSLATAYDELENRKKEEIFKRRHESTDELRHGVKKLTEFLERYKNHPTK